MRQTDLTVAQLTAKLDDPTDSSFPRCLYINELGELAQAGDRDAEQALWEYLGRFVDAVEQAPAYLHLMMVRDPLNGTHKAVRTFSGRPENAPIVAWARKQHGIAPPQ